MVSLFSGDHNIFYAHNDEYISATLGAYDKALSKIYSCFSTGTLEKQLSGPAINPVFNIR